MTRHRTTPRGALLLLTLCGAAVAAACAQGARTPLVFPVLGPAAYTSDFGDPRGSSRHEGNDIMAPRKAIAVAAEGGTVKFWTTSANAGCMLYLYGDSGTTYLYIHLNNDLGTGNDNKGSCVAGTAYAPRMKSGDRVEAGQPVGFVGDSGDANGISPHLHFEVHPKDGAAANPYPLLQKAQRLLFSEPDGTTFTLILDGVVTAIAPGTVTLAVDTLKEWPSHQKATKLGRTITLALPPTSNVVSSPAAAQSLLAPTPVVGSKIRLWTGPQSASPEARTAADGAISVLRLLLK
jgi:hypothetical protein